jgi:hypothetical protein
VKKGQNLGVPKEDRSDQSKETSLENENSSESSEEGFTPKNIIIERKKGETIRQKSISDSILIKSFSDSKPISRITEFKIIQYLISDIKSILEFEPKVLENQNFYWIKIQVINDENQRERIKVAIEKHCLTPLRWIGNNDIIEININPSYKIMKKRS